MKLYKLDFDDIIDLLVDEDKEIRKLAFKLLQKEENVSKYKKMVKKYKEGINVKRNLPPLKPKNKWILFFK